MSNLTHLGGGVFQWVLQTTWQAAVLAGLILPAQALLRKRLPPSWRYGLWLLLVVRLLMPVSPQSAFSIFNPAGTEPPLYRGNQSTALQCAHCQSGLNPPESSRPMFPLLMRRSERPGLVRATGGLVRGEGGLVWRRVPRLACRASAFWARLLRSGPTTCVSARALAAINPSRRRA